MFTSWDEARDNIGAMKGDWQAFQRGSLSGTTIRMPILHSWERSQKAGVSPGGPTGLVPWGDRELVEARATHSDLITSAAPVMADLKAQLAGTEQVVALCDPSVRALFVEGDAAARRSAEQILLVPGADWSEGACGTNAMGTALVEQRTTTIFASEHYVEGLHRWACVAVPIFSPTSGHLMGILDLSGHCMTVSRHTIIAVTSAVETIRTRLALLESTRQEALMGAYLDQVTRSRGNSIGLVDRHGNVLKSSSTVVQQLGLSPVWAEGMRRVLRTAEEHREEVERSNGSRTRVTFRPVHLGGVVVGAVVEVAAASSGSQPAQPRQPVPGLVGNNPAWLATVDRAMRAARTESTVLITGETGTGKEVLAKAIHQSSARRSGPFVAVNCGALPPSLVASELFGYVGGAFSGANPKGNPGRVEAANGGTLFLDEVSELTLEAQVHLLRVLQEREVVRVGSHRSTPVDIRVIAATNRNLQAMIQQGTFRQDLFFRLHVVPLSVPPLRERREDILPLVEYAYRRLNQEPPDLGLASCERLTAHMWPGNIRELLNLVEQACVLGEDPATLLPVEPLSITAPADRTVGDADEETRIRLALDQCGGNAAAAARILGMGRSTLYRKLELYDIRLQRSVQ